MGTEGSSHNGLWKIIMSVHRRQPSLVDYCSTRRFQPGWAWLITVAHGDSNNDGVLSPHRNRAKRGLVSTIYDRTPTVGQSGLGGFVVSLLHGEGRE